MADPGADLLLAGLLEQEAQVLSAYEAFRAGKFRPHTRWAVGFAEPIQAQLNVTMTCP